MCDGPWLLEMAIGTFAEAYSIPRAITMRKQSVTFLSPDSGSYIYMGRYMSIDI